MSVQQILMAMLPEVTSEQRGAIREVLELLESVECTGDSSDDGASYMVMGNVDTLTLRALGFDIPKEVR